MTGNCFIFCIIYPSVEGMEVDLLNKSYDWSHSIAYTSCLFPYALISWSNDIENGYALGVCKGNSRSADEGKIEIGKMRRLLVLLTKGEGENRQAILACCPCNMVKLFMVVDSSCCWKKSRRWSWVKMPWLNMVVWLCCRKDCLQKW